MISALRASQSCDLLIEVHGAAERQPFRRVTLDRLLDLPVGGGNYGGCDVWHWSELQAFRLSPRYNPH